MEEKTMPDGIGINRLVAISTLKADAANEDAAAIEVKPKPKPTSQTTTQTTTSFDTYSKAISETFATKALYPKIGDTIVADKTQGSTQTAPPPKEKKPAVDGEATDKKHDSL